MKPEIIFTLLVCILASAFAFFFAPYDGVTEIVTLRLIYLAILFAAFFGVVMSLRGTEFDVLKEIFVEHNVAASVLVGAIIVALAVVIGG